jgi:hypothetical protein
MIFDLRVAASPGLIAPMRAAASSAISDACQLPFQSLVSVAKEGSLVD